MRRLLLDVLDSQLAVRCDCGLCGTVVGVYRQCTKVKASAISNGNRTDDGATNDEHIRTLCIPARIIVMMFNAY